MLVEALPLQMKPVPWLKLRVLGQEAPPVWLRVGGCAKRSQTLNGVYELLPEGEWGTRPVWRRLSGRPQRSGRSDASNQSITAPSAGYLSCTAGYPKYMFFWPETGHWVVGPDPRRGQTGLARNGPGRWAVESPDRCPGRWTALDGSNFREDPGMFCRRWRGASGGMSASLPFG